MYSAQISPTQKTRKGEDGKGERRDLPFAREVLGDDSDKPLQRTQNGSVDHDRSFKLGSNVGIGTLVGSSVSQVESFWDVEVELMLSGHSRRTTLEVIETHLDGTTLPLSLERIFKLKVELATSVHS